MLMTVADEDDGTGGIVTEGVLKATVCLPFPDSLFDF